MLTYLLSFAEQGNKMPIPLTNVTDSVGRETTQGGLAPDGMVRISGGPFRMGSETGSDAERPMHLVDVDEFIWTCR